MCSRASGEALEPINVYNPWSVLSYRSRPQAGLKPYRVNTSDNLVLKELLTSGGYRVEQELLTLLQGGSIAKPLREFLVIRELMDTPDALWSILLMAG